MVWSIKKAGDQSHILTVKYDRKEDWEHWVLLTADRHWDNPYSNHKLQIKHLEQAKERNAPVIDVGDLFCAMQGSKDKRGNKSALRDEHKRNDYFSALVETATEFFKPYKEQLALICRGNHETSIIKHNEIDLTNHLCKNLGVEPGRYGGYVIFRFARGKATIAIRMRYFHGSGGGGIVTKGVIQTNRRAVMWPDADIIVSGHIHESWVLENTQERVNNFGEISYKNQVHIQLPTYKEEHGKDGWHDQRGAPPKPIGAYWLKFYNDGYDNIKFKAVRAD